MKWDMVMDRDRGPERIRLEIRKDTSVSVTFLGEDRTRVESSDVYFRGDVHARQLHMIEELRNKNYELQEKIEKLENNC